MAHGTGGTTAVGSTVGSENSPLCDMKLLITLFIVLFATGSGGREQFAGKPEMNGYRFKDYDNFWEKWKLVTVRYRRDTNELRFTYANDKAWKALLEGGKDFPDGAIFGKVGLASREDPAFPSSLVPAGSRRYQLMVKNKKKHADTAGWGYALFSNDGLTLPEDPVVKTKACHACHTVVAAHDYIFSRMVDMGTLDAATESATRKEQDPWPFIDSERDFMPEPLKSHIPEKWKKIRQLKGILEHNLFQGTLDEIRPFLLKESLKSGVPAVLIGMNRNSFSAVIPLEGACQGGVDGKAFRAITSSLNLNEPLIFDSCEKP